MAKCIDCCHFDVCKHKLEELCKFTKIEDLIHNCSKFKERTNYVEVVRCKDCEYYEGDECVNPYIFMSDGAHLYTDPDDFCSYGERRE